MVRRLLMPTTSVAAVWGTARLLAWATAALLDAVDHGTAGLNELLGLAAALAAWAVLAWVVAVLLTTAVAALPGALGRTASRVAYRLAPATARNAARLAVGLAVTAGPVAAGPAAAAAPPAVPDSAVHTEVVDVSELPGVGRPGQPVPPGSAHEPGPAAVDPSPSPATEHGADAGVPGTAPSSTQPPGDERTEAGGAAGQTPEAGLAPEPAREADPVDEVVVRRGDTLWAIAARHLGPDATTAEIAAEWPRWYAANRSVIGDDPDLILPGTILRPPLDR